MSEVIVPIRAPLTGRPEADEEIAEALASQMVSTAREMASRKIDGTNLNPSSPGEPPALQTGELWSSIGILAERGGGERDVEASAEHASYMEFGTRYVAPRPYMQPAFEQTMAQAPEIIEDVMSQLPPQDLFPPESSIFDELAQFGADMAVSFG